RTQPHPRRLRPGVIGRAGRLPAARLGDLSTAVDRPRRGPRRRPHPPPQRGSGDPLTRERGGFSDTAPTAPPSPAAGSLLPRHRRNRYGSGGVLHEGRTEQRTGGRPLEDEARLVERARQGDGSAYEALVQRYQEVSFRVAYVISGGAAEAEDAAQEAFVKAYF